MWMTKRQPNVNLFQRKRRKKRKEGRQAGKLNVLFNNEESAVRHCLSEQSGQLIFTSMKYINWSAALWIG